MTLDRLGERSGVLQGEVNREMTEVGAPIPFDHVKHLGMRQTFAEENPRLVVEPGRIDDERVLLPCADGMPHPRGIRVVRVPSAIKKYLAVMRLLLEQLHHQGSRLNELGE